MVQEKGVLVRRSLPVRQLCPPLVCRLECRSCIRDDCLVVAFTSGRHDLDGSVAGFTDVYSVELICPACWLVYYGAEGAPCYNIFLRQSIEVTSQQWSNCGGTTGNGVPLPFLAGERRSPSLHDDSYLQHKQQKKCALNA